MLPVKIQFYQTTSNRHHFPPSPSHPHSAVQPSTSSCSSTSQPKAAFTVPPGSAAAAPSTNPLPPIAPSRFRSAACRPNGCAPSGTNRPISGQPPRSTRATAAKRLPIARPLACYWIISSENACACFACIPVRNCSYFFVPFESVLCFDFLRSLFSFELIPDYIMRPLATTTL